MPCKRKPSIIYAIIPELETGIFGCRVCMMYPKRSWRWSLVLALFVLFLLAVPAVNAQTAGVLSVEGDELFDEGKYEEALEKYDQALALEPNLAMAWVGKGMAHNALEDYSEALDAFEMAISINPGYAKAWYGKGVALYGLGRYEESIEAFDKALEIYPEYGYILYYGKANAYFAMNDYSSAIPLYEKALTLKPDYSPGWTRLGEALSASGDFQAAIDAFDKALALDPGDLRAQAGKTAAEAELGGGAAQTPVGETATTVATVSASVSDTETPLATEVPATPTKKAPISPMLGIAGLIFAALCIGMRTRG
jgi:tetratricopeptide (TPR) repeat protein